MKDIDMDLVTKYMIEHDCKLDEAITAIKKKTTPTTRTSSGSAVTKLKTARLSAGLSQSQLAEKADLKLRTLQAYEAGQRSFDSARLDTLLKVAIACNCKLEDLITDTDCLDTLKAYSERF